MGCPFGRATQGEGARPPWLLVGSFHTLLRLILITLDKRGLVDADREKFGENLMGPQQVGTKAKFSSIQQHLAGKQTTDVPRTNSHKK